MNNYHSLIIMINYLSCTSIIQLNAVEFFDALNFLINFNNLI